MKLALMWCHLRETVASSSLLLTVVVDVNQIEHELVN